MFKFGKKNKNIIEKKESRTGKTLVYGVNQVVYKQKDYSLYSTEGYQQNVVAFQCIDMIAKGAASIKLKYFDGEQEITKSNQLANLIKKPNETQSQEEFFESVYSYYLIQGNSYIELKPVGNSPNNYGNPIYIYSLRPDRMSIKAGANGLPSGYEFRGSNGSKVIFPVSKIGKSNIIHTKTFNPINDWYGLSPLDPAAYSIDQHNEASKWNLALLENGARPSGALVMTSKDNEGNLTDEQYQRLKTQMDDNYQGAKNSGRPLLLDGGLDWREMSLNPKDMDYMNTKNTAAREIARAFNVPSQLLGIQGDSTYNNMAEARLALWENTIIPLAQKFITKLNNQLVPRFGDNLRIELDKDSIEALTIKHTIKAETLEKLSYITVNEKRLQMGLEPINGGDQLQSRNQQLPDLSKDQYIDSIVKDGCTKLEAKKIADIIYD